MLQMWTNQKEGVRKDERPHFLTSSQFIFFDWSKYAFSFFNLSASINFVLKLFE